MCVYSFTYVCLCVYVCVIQIEDIRTLCECGKLSDSVRYRHSKFFESGEVYVLF